MTAFPRIGRPIAAMAAAVALLVATAGPAGAQERFSGLTGTVTVASGAVLPGATITITNKQTGKVFTAVSGADGVYRVLDLEPGRYTVKFEISGFSTSEVPDLNLLLGKTLTVDSSLRVGGLTEAISVTAESPLIDTRSTTIAHNVTAEEIERIPKGRTFQNLAVASPSVNAGQVQGGIQVNGASGAENAVTIDGVVTNSLIDGRSRQDAVPPGSAGEDRRHQRRVRRRARRRHQRGDQVRRQRLPRRGAAHLRQPESSAAVFERDQPVGHGPGAGLQLRRADPGEPRTGRTRTTRATGWRTCSTRARRRASRSGSCSRPLRSGRLGWVRMDSGAQPEPKPKPSWLHLAPP